MSRNARSKRLLSCQREGARSVVRDAHFVLVEAQDLGERFGGVGVVVDDEHPMSMLAWVSGGAGDSWRVVRGLGLLQALLERQSHGELASAARARAFRGDGAAMQLDQALRDRKTEAETALGPFDDARSLREEIEQTRPQVFGDADAVVPDRDQSAAPARTRGDVDGSSLLGVLALRW